LPSRFRTVELRGVFILVELVVRLAKEDLRSFIELERPFRSEDLLLEGTILLFPRISDFFGDLDGPGF